MPVFAGPTSLMIATVHCGQYRQPTLKGGA
jgi:hypothetical protein